MMERILPGREHALVREGFARVAEIPGGRFGGVTGVCEGALGPQHGVVGDRPRARLMPGYCPAAQPGGLPEIPSIPCAPHNFVVSAPAFPLSFVRIARPRAGLAVA